MTKYKTESELIISQSDVLVKQRYAFKISRSGPQRFEIRFPLKIRSAKARDKHGALPIEIIKPSSIRISVDRDLSVGQVHGVEVTLLIVPDHTTLGDLTVLEWGSLDLYRVQLLTRPFQVIGFGAMTIQDGRWIFTENLNQGMSANIAGFRSSRIELGGPLRIKLALQMVIDCSAGGRVNNIHTYGPTASKRQQTKLLTPNISINHDKNGNPRYQLPVSVGPGEKKSFKVEWEVIISKGWENSTDLGTMSALKILTQKEQKFTQYLTPSEFWQINHPAIKKIAGASTSSNQIYKVHRFLFEFVNRKLQYTLTGNRQSAINALQSKSGDCSEFADLLVTLHRAVGIPSRVVEGIILKNGKQLSQEGHAWVEFLTTKGWMACDPTWGIPLSITSQHIEFSHQKIAEESKVYQLEFTGQAPKVSHRLVWSAK